MSEAISRKIVDDLIYLIRCAVNGTEVDRDRAGAMDMAALYAAAEKHLLTAVTAMALESAGIRDEAFTQARGKAIRKVAAMDMDRAAFLDELEKKGIWHMPLKGAVMKDLYPRLGMRQMSDNDILLDPSRMAEAGAILERMGFACEHRSSAHVVYNKAPVSSFELHHRLFGADQGHRIYRYYKDVKTRLIRDEGTRERYHFSDEDFYVYMVAHENKHYREGGTGLRSLLDTYVYCRQKGQDLDWTYIGEQTEELGIRDFEERIRSLALHLFGEESLTEDEESMLAYILSSGTYGTMQHKVSSKVEKFGGGRSGKFRYVLSRVVLPMDTVRTVYPTFARVPVLLPFLPIWRLLRGLRSRRKKLAGEWKTLKDK